MKYTDYKDYIIERRLTDSMETLRVISKLSDMNTSLECYRLINDIDRLMANIKANLSYEDGGAS